MLNFINYLKQENKINSEEDYNFLSNLFLDKVENNYENIVKLVDFLEIAPNVFLDLQKSFYKLNSLEFDIKEYDSSLTEYIQLESALNNGIVCASKEGDSLTFGVLNPENPNIDDVLNFVSISFEFKCKFFLISLSDFNLILEPYKRLNYTSKKIFDQFDSEREKKVDKKKKFSIDGILGKEDLDLENRINLKKEGIEEEEIDGILSHELFSNSAINLLINDIFKEAVKTNTSDIHIEKHKNSIIIKFRIDGILIAYLNIKPKVFDSLIAKIKILSDLKIDEKRRPQDGQISQELDNGYLFEGRVSIIPTYFAEKIVIRVFAKIEKGSKLKDLGFQDSDIEYIKELTKSTEGGIILVSGPTGSGKSTTLYNLINFIDTKVKNVISLEDPVETHVEGVNQSNIDHEIGYNFSSGLRSILRQDPDVILIGEIRDRETAGLAVQAALTGHLVFSTIHTNSSVGVVNRLFNMGVEKYAIASSLKLVISQRLLPKIKGEKKSFLIKDNYLYKNLLADNLKNFEKKEYKEKFLKEIGPNFYTSKERDKLGHPIIKGRIGVYEILKINKDMEDLILETNDERKIYKQARVDGLQTLKEDIMIKSSQGIIPIEEVFKF